MKMHLFSFSRTPFRIAMLAALSLMAPSFIYAGNPISQGTTQEITIDNFDSGGNASGATGSTGYLLGSFGIPMGVSTLSGGGYVLNAGYFGQDLVSPSIISSIWNVPGGTARSITLQWISPGDNERDDSNLVGSRFNISTTTVLGSAQDPLYWSTRRDTPDVIVSTANVAAKSLCTYQVTGLMPAVTYYFRIWTMDQATNWSDLSAGGTTFAQPVTLSVYVVDPSTFDFGWQQAAASTVSASGILVRNNGNTTEAYFLRVTTGTSWPANTVWKSSTTPATNQYVLYSMFNGTRPASTDFMDNEGNDIVTLYNILCDTTNFSMGNQAGKAVPPFMTQALLCDNTMWFKLKMPLLTSTTTAQILPVVITAEESP